MKRRERKINKARDTRKTAAPTAGVSLEPLNTRAVAGPADPSEHVIPQLGLGGMEPSYPRDSMRLGPVSLEAAPGWWFYPMPDRLAARPLHGVGVFQVRPIATPPLPKPASHEICMALAIANCGHTVKRPGLDPARDRVGKCVIGGESFRAGGTFVRVYYHLGPRGFAVGSFSCKASRIIERNVKQSIRDSDRMMHSVRRAPPPPS